MKRLFLMLNILSLLVSSLVNANVLYAEENNYEQQQEIVEKSDEQENINSIGFDDIREYREIQNNNPDEQETASYSDDDIMASGSCTEKINWILKNDGELEIIGEGEMDDYSPFSSPWFEYKDSIKEINVCDGITNIGYSAFSGCPNLVTVQLGNSVTKISNTAFYDCRKLSDVTLSNNLVEIGYLAFGYTKSLENIVLPSSLTTLGEYAFMESGITSIEIFGNVESVSQSCFSQCRDLKTVIINEGVKSIDNETFKSSIETIYLPKTIISIGQNAFSNNTKIIYNGTYSDFISIEGIYNSGINESKVTFIGYIDSGILNNQIYYELTSDGTLTISGEGYINDFVLNGDIYRIPDYQSSPDVSVKASNQEFERMKNSGVGAPWYKYRNEVINVVISEGISNIPDGAFINCKNLESVQLPSTVTTIGNYAFNDCENLETINISSNINSIGVYSFYGCSTLSAEVFEDIETIGECALDFMGDKKMSYDNSLLCLEKGIGYLNEVYLKEESSLGLDLYGINLQDIEILQELVNDITKDCTTDKDKCIAIYNWVKNYEENKPDISFYAVSYLAKASAECAGLSQITASLMKIAGIKTAIANGTKENTKVKDLHFTYLESSSFNHQWVLAYYENDWHLYDVAWGYYDLNDHDIMAEQYYLTGIDGIFIYGDIRINPLKILSIKHAYGGIYNNGLFSTLIDENGISIYESGISNSGITFCASSELINNQKAFYDNQIFKQDGLFDTYEIRNNGLLVTQISKQDGSKFYSYDSEGHRLQTTKEFASTRRDGKEIYMVKGDYLQVLPMDLREQNSKITIDNKRFNSNRDETIKVEKSGVLNAVKEGENYISIFDETGLNHYDFIVNVVDDYNDLPTSVLIQNLCNHEFTTKVIKNQNGETYDCDEYCKFCGKLIKTEKTKQTISIDHINLSSSSFNYDGHNHIPNVTIVDKDGNILEEYYDYDLNYDDNIKSCGKHNIEIICKGRYVGKFNKEYEIVATNFDGDYYHYNEDTKTLTINNVDSLSDYNELGERPWNVYANSIENVVVEEGVEVIGTKAFEDLENLRIVYLPSTINEIKKDSFKNCINLDNVYYEGNSDESWNAIVNNESNNILTDNIIVIENGTCGENTFYNYYHNGNFKVYGDGKVEYFQYKNLRKYDELYRIPYADCIKKIIICDGIEEIVEKAFHNLNNLEEISLSNTLESINNSVFSYDKKIEYVEIPSSVKSIGEYAFANCTNLKDVILNEGLEIIGKAAFEYCALVDVSLPNSLTSIGGSTFNNCQSLESVVLNNGLNSIPDRAFCYCKSLQYINIPNSVKSIGKYAFSDSGLVSINFGSGVLEIEDHAFYNCKFGNVDLPIGLIELGTYAFGSCINLESINLPNSPLVINDNCFASCGKLKELILPEKVVEVGNTVINASNIEFIYIKGQPLMNGPIVQSNYDDVLIAVKELEKSNKWNINWNIKTNDNRFMTLFGVSDENYELIKTGNITFEEFMTDESVYASGSAGDNSSFTYYGTGLMEISGTGSASIPSFSGHNRSVFRYPVINLIVNEGITNFNGSNCMGKYLASIKLPNSLERLSQSAYEECSKLQEITMPISTEYTSNSFVRTGNVEKLTLTKGNGGCCSYTGDNSIFRLNNKSLKSITIEDGAETIVNGMFYYCRFTNPITLSLPSSIKTIGYQAFDQSNLKKIVINNEDCEIGHTAFINNGFKTAGPIGGGYDIEFAWINKIPDYAFNQAELESIVIPSTIKTIGANAFLGCRQLTSIVLPDSVTNVGNSAFMSCENLKQMSVPISTKFSGSDLSFYGVSLENVIVTKGNGIGVNYDINTYANTPYNRLSNTGSLTFEEGIKSIGEYQFYHLNNYGQDTLELPDSLEKINKCGLAHCYGLSTIVLPITTNVDKDAFGTNNICELVFKQTEGQEVTELNWPPVDLPANIIEALGVNKRLSVDYQCKEIQENNVDVDEKQLLDEVRQEKEYSHGMYIDVSMSLQSGDVNEPITETKEPMSVSIDVTGKGLEQTNKNICRQYKVIRVHEGQTSVISATLQNDTISFESDKFSTYELVYVDVENQAELKEGSLTLDDDVKVNLYIDIDDSLVSNNDAHLVLKNITTGETKDIKVCNLVKDTNKNLYKASMSVVAKGLTETIQAQLFIGNDAVSNTMSYSGRQYIKTVLNPANETASWNSSKLINVCKKLANFGAYSQIYFDYHTEKLANDFDYMQDDDKNVRDVQLDELIPYKMTKQGSVNGIKATETKLILDAQTICRITYELSEGYSVDNFTFRIADKTVEPVVKGKTVYVEYPSVAKDLGTMTKVTVTDNTDTLEIQYNAMNYAYQIIKAEESKLITQELKNVCKTIYDYYLAANEYFN